MKPALLEVRRLAKHFAIRGGVFGRPRGVVRAVDGVSFDIAVQQSFGLVGESGCGKSTLGKTLMGIYRPTSGEIRFEGQDVTALGGRERRQHRGRVQYVYQDAGASLDPWWKVGWSLNEALRVHSKLTRGERRRHVDGMMQAVGLGPEHLGRYPHEFSGGQQRRLALARVLLVRPRLVIFDESTAGLDVSVQASVLRLIADLKAQFGLTYLFISHDLGVIRTVCDSVAVMYLGAIVEVGPTERLFDAPLHPYTKALLSASSYRGLLKTGDEIILQGDPPAEGVVPAGCRFRTRCPYAQDDPCARSEPPLEAMDDGRIVACHFVRPASGLGAGGPGDTLTPKSGRTTPPDRH